MKTNVSIELTDDQRDRLANEIDGKVTKRLATRADITAMVSGSVDRILAGDGRATMTIPVGTGKTGTPVRAGWKMHPNLQRFSKEIHEGIERHGYTAQSQIDSYRRMWTVEPFRSQ